MLLSDGVGGSPICTVRGGGRRLVARSSISPRGRGGYALNPQNLWAPGGAGGGVIVLYEVNMRVGSACVLANSTVGDLGLMESKKNSWREGWKSSNDCTHLQLPLVFRYTLFRLFERTSLSRYIAFMYIAVFTSGRFHAMVVLDVYLHYILERRLGGCSGNVPLVSIAI